ncbi:uncharacterized protein LOC123671274 [Harmonia axyridis]|uniref:uncharacterized protein LOC123671274 n=1 Tax=Harmonia axyridis TaxID=115357 RepID=UPI001E27590D|nr:uncharacterized protein LOC123671274 [Harmonia axyridis]
MGMEEKLIEAVRGYPCLYDTTNPYYIRTKYKQEIWGNIANKLNLENGNDAKYAWSKLRNNHRDSLRRQKRYLRSGASAKHLKSWKFQSQMEFLIKYMVNEKDETNFTIEDEEPPTEPLNKPENLEIIENEPENFEITEIKSENLDITENKPEDLEITELSQVSMDNVERTSDAPATDQNEYSTPLKKTNRKRNKTDIEELLHKTLEQREQRSKERREERKQLVEKMGHKDSLDLFFMSMCEMTKKLPVASQHFIKNSLFVTVSQEEARVLSFPRTIFPTQPYFPGDMSTRPSYPQQSTVQSSRSHMSSASTSQFHSDDSN